MTTPAPATRTRTPRRPALSPLQRAKVADAIAHHERFGNSYFWTPPSNATSRRLMESRETFGIGFVASGTAYRFESTVSCSCKNVYYTGRFYVDGEKKTVRAFRALIA